MTTIINALLPVFVTLMLGYFAAWHQDQDSASASVLNKMVMTYTLPLSLFAGTVTTSRHQLIANLPLMATLLVGLAAPFLVTLAVARILVRRGLGESTLQALAISFPAVPFIGLPVLGTIFGTQEANLTVAVSGLVTNLMIVPVSIVLLTLATAGQGASSSEHSSPRAGSIIWSAVQKPVIWAPVLAVVIVAAGVTLPRLVVTPLQLLGSTTSGISLFASGVILRAQRPTISAAIITSTVLRLAVVPGVALLAFPLVGLTDNALSESVVALAMPCAVMLIILSVQYKVAQIESASVLLYSYLFSTVSMTLAVLLTR